MIITTSDYVYVAIIVVWIFTLFRTLIIMCGGSKVFKKANKGDKSAYIPFINLFVMLEVCDISPFWGILLFTPVLNIVILTWMSYKLGKVFYADTKLLLGLILCPPIFYIILFNSDRKYALRDEEYFKALDSARGETINLMTETEVKDLNNAKVEDYSQVDSIFKSQAQQIEQADTYKANKIDNDILSKIDALGDADDPYFKPIEKVDLNKKEEDNLILRELKEDSFHNDTNKFLEEKKDDNVEFIDL